MFELTSLLRLSYESVGWRMYRKWQIKNMFSFLHPVAKIWLIGRRKHLTTSQVTPKWSVGPLMLWYYRYRFLKGPKLILRQKLFGLLQKLYGKYEQATSKWWRRRPLCFMILYSYIFGSFKKERKTNLKKLFAYFWVIENICPALQLEENLTLASLNLKKNENS